MREEPHFTHYHLTIKLLNLEQQGCIGFANQDVKSQLLCGVRLELAVGSLPYPGKSGFPIVSPGRGRLIWIPNSKPCLDVRQNPSRDTHFPSYGRRPLPKTKKKPIRIF